MRSRNVRILNRSVPLLPLIAALIIGSVTIGFASNGFLTLINNPVQQTTYQRQETITIGDISEYIEASVTLDGEVNENGEFVLGRPISVGLVINSLRDGFRVSDDYTLILGIDTVLSGEILNVEVGVPHEDAGTWTPLELGPVTVALDIINMVWTEIQYATFAALTYEETDPVEDLTLVSNTLPAKAECGTAVDFQYVVYNEQTWVITGWLWRAETSSDGGLTWGEVASGTVWEDGAYVLISNTDGAYQDYTGDISFTAPNIEGDYKVRLTIYDIRADGEGEPGT